MPAAELEAALASRPDEVRGAALYATCTACHGADGGGVADGSIPAIAGQPQRVLVKQLVDFRASQRQDIRMEHFADRRHLQGAQDLADVAAHVARLPRHSATHDAAGRIGMGDGAAVDAGARAWFAGCESCHGATGQGDGSRFLPRLAGQHAGYLERQLLDVAAGRRANMLQTHRAPVRRLTEVQIAGIADYLSRLK